MPRRRQEKGFRGRASPGNPGDARPWKTPSGCFRGPTPPWKTSPRYLRRLCYDLDSPILRMRMRMPCVMTFQRIPGASLLRKCCAKKEAGANLPRRCGPEKDQEHESSENVLPSLPWQSTYFGRLAPVVFLGHVMCHPAGKCNPR